MLQGITSLKNELSPSGFQEPQVLAGVRNGVTTFSRRREGREMGDGRRSRGFQDEGDRGGACSGQVGLE